jgi:deoxyribose-phosphate aldolase
MVPAGSAGSTGAAASPDKAAYSVADPRTLAPFIQHTRIAADLSRADLETHCQEAVELGFNAAMVPASWVPAAVELLAGTGVRVASALDFPVVGVMTPTGKAAEAAAIAEAGADELDIGVQIGYLLSGMEREFEADIAGVVQACGIPVKVMLELPLLPPPLRDRAVDLAMDAGAAYLKNASSGTVEIAHPESIRYLVGRAREGVRVKASGGISSAAQAVDLLDAGAVLLGTSSGVAIVTGGRGGDGAKHAVGHPDAY